MIGAEFLRLSGIRKKLFVYYFSVMLMMALTSYYSYYNARYVLDKTNSIFMDYLNLNRFYTDINSLESNLEKYLATQSSDALLDYYNANNRLQAMIDEKPADLRQDANDLMFADIYHMTENLLKETDAAVTAKRGRNAAEYLSHFANSQKISGYIGMYINDLLYNKLADGSSKYESIARQMNFITWINAVIIIASFLVNIAVAFFLTYRITKPLVRLAHAAESIAREDYNIAAVPVGANDEIAVLTKAFNQMVVSIRNHITKLIRQKETEERLREQEVQNLTIKNLLKEAELKALQAQINPHFFFNTLNYAAQLAMIEGADASSAFIQKAAELFRYSLKGLDRPVSLGDEIDNVKSYSYILKARFNGRVDVFFNIDERLLDTIVPGLIVQPVVENALIHGIEGLDRKGLIYLNVQNDQNLILIEVIDNGRGMNPQKREEILVPDPKPERGYHTTGLGLRNVVERLMLFYNASNAADVMEIYSKEGAGTRVVLKLPRKGDNEVVPLAGS